MKLFNTFIIFLFMIFSGINGFCYTRIYLLSEVEINKENLLLSDICKMEGDNSDLISKIVILPELYRDNIVDNKELYDLVSLSINQGLYIFGSGVKIKKSITRDENDSEKVVLVEKGDTVELLIRKNGITIEMKGKALNKGCETEEIDFRLSTGKIVKGKITSVKKADIIL